GGGHVPRPCPRARADLRRARRGGARPRSLSPSDQPGGHRVTAPDERAPSSKRDLRARLAFLDGLRGLAAFYVMVGHARMLLWEGYSEGFLKHPSNYSIGAKAVVYFFSFFRYGYQVVLLFFVLSGFVIHLRYAKQLCV